MDKKLLFPMGLIGNVEQSALAADLRALIGMTCYLVGAQC